MIKNASGLALCTREESVSDAYSSKDRDRRTVQSFERGRQLKANRGPNYKTFRVLSALLHADCI